MSEEAFYTGKARIVIKKEFSDEVIVDDIYDFVAPRDDRDEFQTVVLAKRFMQIRSLVETRPWNILRKMKEAIDVKFQLKFIEGKYHYSGIEETNKTMYVWRTNNGYEVYLIEDDCDRVFVIFTTSTNKKYCIVINRKFIADIW